MNRHTIRKPTMLRLLILCIVALASVKFLLGSQVNRDADMSVEVDEEKRVLQQRGALRWEEEWEKNNEGPGGRQVPDKPRATSQLDSSPTQFRVVHFDLKGAAPKVSYLEQIFPLLSTLGANGILLEYEDMFPFEGDLQILRSPYAYSAEDIEKIRYLAGLSNLEVIPLVQVFGHLEFALKHNKFAELREVPEYPNSLNPHTPGSQALVRSMLSQVLDKHPGTRWLHIGADEVFGLGEGLDSKNWLNSNNGDLGKMFLNHVKEVGSYVTDSHPGLGLLMWDDMMRHISVETLRESGLPNFVSPMVWRYHADLETNQIETYISSYQAAGFSNVWFASAFKGASGPAQDWTPVSYHLNNHLGWLKVINAMSRFPSIHFQGIVLTGWQRYDHFSVLCELFPVGIPSLAVCLQTLKHDGFTDEAKKQIQYFLGCKNFNLDKNLCEGGGSFPGNEVYQMVLHIRENLQNDIQKLLANNLVRGWFSRYHRKYQFGNPRNLEKFKDRLSKLLEDWESYLQNFRTHLEDIFFPDTVEEWMEENVNEYMDQLRSLATDFEAVIKRGGQPKLL